MTETGDVAVAPAIDVPSVSALGQLLDADHPAATNGWMSVCRRCGFATDHPLGVHAPAEKQLPRVEKWLDLQRVGARAAAFKLRHDT